MKDKKICTRTGRLQLSTEGIVSCRKDEGKYILDQKAARKYTLAGPKMKQETPRVSFGFGFILSGIKCTTNSAKPSELLEQCPLGQD